LEFDGEVVLRPLPLIAEPANLWANDIKNASWLETMLKHFARSVSL